ncbi:MAG TPA: hypothetical protein VHC22_28640 [Pirellulales bacterium]|nr:hypothetical protein [Pirellulales bacterium]
MDENRKKRGGASVALLLALLLVAYPLSIGPAVALLGMTNIHPAAHFVFKAVYLPLGLVVDALPASARPIFEDWLDLWDFYRIL